MYNLLPTPPNDYDPLGLIQPMAGLSFDFRLTGSASGDPPSAPDSSPPSYDPMSPSYDPCAASPCNPFPTSSPFASFTFQRAGAGSRLRFEDSHYTEPVDPCADLPPTPVTQPPIQSLLHAAALSRIPPPHSAPSLRRTKPCRFYLDPAGCKSGRWCNFKHPVGAHCEDRLSNENSALDELHAAVARFRMANDIANRDTSMWDDIPDVRDLDPNWGKKSEGEVHPKWRTQPCRNFLLGLCRYGDKCQFIHPPGLFPANAPDTYPTSFPYPSSVDVPAIPVSVWGAHPGIGIATSEYSPDGISSTKPTQMSLYFRTKPCKYFDIDGTCPHGEACKFIHDPKKSSPSSTCSSSTPSPTVPRPSWADDDRELDLEEVPYFAGTDPDADGAQINGEAAMEDMTNNAPRSSSMRRRERARARNGNQKDGQQTGGIFKPSWRVVGGGVMLASPAKYHSQRDDDYDAVLDCQPRDSSLCSADSSGSSFTDDYDYNYASFSNDPTQYPPNELLRTPSAEAALHVTMGNIDAWNPPQPPRKRPKKHIVTGADLMRGITGATAEEGFCGQPGHGGSLSPHKERERQKPRLTIAVPAFSQAHCGTQSFDIEVTSGRVVYPTPKLCCAGVAQSGLATRTDNGDDLLDWGEDDDYESDGSATMDDKAGNGTRAVDGEEIRRVRSTPPTPRSSASYLDVPVMPRLAAESP